MKFRQFSSLITMAGALVLYCSGCGPKAQTNAPPNMSQEQVSQTIQSVFDGANPELQTRAAQVESAAKQQDPQAVSGLVQLLHSPGITPAQRSELAKCLPSLLTSARNAAEAGDARAAEALRTYNYSK